MAFVLYELVSVKNCLRHLIKLFASVSHRLKWHFLFQRSSLGRGDLFRTLDMLLRPQLCNDKRAMIVRGLWLLLEVLPGKFKYLINNSSLFVIFERDNLCVEWQTQLVHVKFFKADLLYATCF